MMINLYLQLAALPHLPLLAVTLQANPLNHHGPLHILMFTIQQRVQMVIQAKLPLCVWYKMSMDYHKKKLVKSHSRFCLLQHRRRVDLFQAIFAALGLSWICECRQKSPLTFMNGCSEKHPNHPWGFVETIEDSHSLCTTHTSYAVTSTQGTNVPKFPFFKAESVDLFSTPFCPGHWSLLCPCG